MASGLQGIAGQGNPPSPPPSSHVIIRSESLIIQTLKCAALLEKSVIFLHKMFHVNCKAFPVKHVELQGKQAAFLVNCSKHVV